MTNSDTRTTKGETRKQIAERLVLEHAPRYAGESGLLIAIEAALKDRDEINDRAFVKLVRTLATLNAKGTVAGLAEAIIEDVGYGAHRNE